MKMFKKLLAVALAGVLALSVLTACSSGGSGGSAAIGATGKAVMQYMKANPASGYTAEGENKINLSNYAAAQATKSQDNLLTSYINGYLHSNSFKTRFGRRTDTSQSVIDYFKWELQNGATPNDAGSIFRSIKGADSSIELMQAAIIKVEKADTDNVSKQASALWNDLSTVYCSYDQNLQGTNPSPDPSKNIYLSVSDLFEVDGEYYRIAFLTGRLNACG